MPVFLKRAYAKPSSKDGCRVLVDRIWPRGRSKDELEIDQWLKEAAPSDKLRKSFHSGDLNWGEFRNRYLAELKNHRDELRRLVEISDAGRLTLVYSSKDPDHNNAVVLRQYLKMLGGN